MDGETPEEILSDEIDSFLGPEDEDGDPSQEQDAGADQEAGDDGDADQGDGADESDADDGDDNLPPIDAPISWDAEAKDHFATLDRKTQEIIAKREGERETYLRNNSHKAETVRHQVENEARDIIAKMYDNHAQALHVYAQRFQPQEPDQRLLYTNDPNDVLTYQRQDAAYRAGAAQQQELHQQIAQAQAQADLARKQAHQAELQSDAQRLEEQLPEWFDPSSGPKLRQELQSIGAELGYPGELMAQANASDILALKKAAEWKSKADKLDKLMGDKMENVRAAKGLPKMARPGVKPTKGQVSATAKQQSWERVKSNPKDGNAFADWLGL